MRIGIVGIDTGVGKTVAAAALAQHMNIPYWKPISCGPDKERDWYRVQRWLGKTAAPYPEAYHFPDPLSPHEAARRAGISPAKEAVHLPTADNLVVEGAGGLLSPFNSRESMHDLLDQMVDSWLLVIQHRLGSINHSMLSLKLLEETGKPIFVLFNGPACAHSESYILENSVAQPLGRLPHIDHISSIHLQQASDSWNALQATLC